MNVVSHKLPLSEKVGYALGDAAANFVWRGALAYMAVFYTDTFGITAAHAALLLLLVRLSDGVTDILMGMVADRTETPWGKFRPWILWSAPVLGLFMALCFTTPDLSYTGKIIWASVTYVGLTLAYTVNNVPYSALMGVMTPDPTERSVLSGFRFAGAFGGGLLVMGFTLTLVEYFGGGDKAQGYQYTMYLFAVLLVAFCLVTYFTTKERVKPVKQEVKAESGQIMDMLLNFAILLLPLCSISIFFYYRGIYSGTFFVVCMIAAALFIRRLLNKPRDNLSHTQKDLVDLLTNKPWLLLLAVGFLFMMFNGIRYGVVAYYFKYYTGKELLAETYFIALLVVSMITALLVGYLTKYISKKNLFALSLFLGGTLNGLVYFLSPDQITQIFVLGCLVEVFAAIMPVLFFSMLGDAADYSEWKNRRRATGLVFSAGTFINKTGGGFAGALVLLVLAGYGYDVAQEATIANSLEGMKLLMSWIPSAFSFAGLAFMLAYPLTTEKLKQVELELNQRRSGGE
jgi:GPH family glycoside/pentoside/hexuronide:cation symporter